jgi:hypothetical protein
VDQVEKYCGSDQRLDGVDSSSDEMKNRTDKRRDRLL